MRKNISLAFLVLALIAVATLLLDYNIKPVTEVTQNSTPPETLAARPAPDFAFTDLENRKHRLSDFRGRIVILHFWATWCAPCIREFPKLASAAKDSHDLIVLAVSSDDGETAIRNFVAKTGPDALKQKNLYLIWDENRAVTHDLYQTFAYPETIIIDTEGRMIRKIPGDADWTGAELKSYLQSLAAPLAKILPKP